MSTYGDFLHADTGHSFADYLNINLPKYEYGGMWNAEKVRMIRKTDTRARIAAQYEIIGEWCDTKREAKASYKAAMKARKAWLKSL